MPWAGDNSIDARNPGVPIIFLRALTRIRSSPNITIVDLGRGQVNQDHLHRLEQRLDDLIAVCKRLKSENLALQKERKGLAEAHSRLSEKTQLIRARVEAMINRLKTLERS